MIKLIEKKITFFEKEERFNLKLDGKEVIAFRYEKQDPEFHDYDNSIVIKNVNQFSAEEIEEIEDFINDEIK